MVSDNNNDIDCDNDNDNDNNNNIRRSTRDLVSVPALLNAYTALQLCFDHGFLLFR